MAAIWEPVRMKEASANMVNKITPGTITVKYGTEGDFAQYQNSHEYGHNIGQKPVMADII